MELGHEEPTLLLTNQMRRSAAKLVERYAHRMLIENNIEDGVNFFHMDALSSAVALKVNCDVQLTLMASSLYRYLGQRIGQRLRDGEVGTSLRRLRRRDGDAGSRRADDPSALSKASSQPVALGSRLRPNGCSSPVVRQTHAICLRLNWCYGVKKSPKACQGSGQRWHQPSAGNP